jgi:hypothetical protein
MTWRYAPFLCAGLLVVSTSARAAQDRASDPPAHISFVDGKALLERDGRLDSTPSNMPLLAGDRVRTQGGRVEILFADGSTLHLDASTTVDFQSDELVRLIDGRIRLSIPGPNRRVSYRIDAPTGSAQISEPGEYRLAVLRGDRDPEIELAVLRGEADLVNEDGRTTLRAGERGFARANTAPSGAYVFNSAAWDAFDRWSEARRDERRGISTQYLPDQVRPYSAAFDRYGSWRYETSYGYVWYPTVTAGWRPYYNGRWVTLRPYGWTWVGLDPWAWATHHYGRWGISAGLWFWIPGHSWAPAWVSWAYAPGYVSWCPLGWNDYPVYQIVYGGGYDPWRAWTVVPRHRFSGGFVNTRGIVGSGIDARVFVPRNTAPEVVGQAIPRASAPIHVAGTGTPEVAGHAIPRASAPGHSAGARAPEVVGQAIPRSSATVRGADTSAGQRVSSPVYTNLEPGASRVSGARQRVIVGQARSALADPPRAETPHAVPRTAPMSPDNRATVADPRSRGAQGRVPSESDPVSAPRSDDRSDAQGRYDARGRHDAQRNDAQGRYGAPGSYGAQGNYDARGRYASPDRAPSSHAIQREDPVYRATPYPSTGMPYPSQRMPYPSQRAPGQTPPERNAPVMARPGPRSDDGGPPAFRRDSFERGPAPSEPGRDPGQHAVPRSSPEGPRPAPQESRPSQGPPPGSRNAPAQEHPSGPPPSAGHSRSGGQPSSGTAVRRPGG